MINFENMTYSRTDNVLEDYRTIDSKDYEDTILSAFTLDFTPFVREDNDEMIQETPIEDKEEVQEFLEKLKEFLLKNDEDLRLFNVRLFSMVTRPCTISVAFRNDIPGGGIPLKIFS